MCYNNMKIHKVKIRNENGVATLDYGKVSEPLAFRRSFLRNILRSIAMDVTLIVDTNLRTNGPPKAPDEELLRRLNLAYAVMPAKPDSYLFFGVRVKSRAGAETSWPQQRLVVDLTGSSFPEELLAVTATYDLSLGFGRKLPFEEICAAYRVGDASLLFDPCFFSGGLYDSAVCTRVRSTFPLEHYIEAVSDEMAL